MKVLGDERMVVHLSAYFERQLGCFHRELVALQLHLPPGDVQRRDNLLIRRGRGVREEGFFEGPLDLMKILVPHQDDRALAQRRHRFVHRIGLIDADAHFIRVRQQMHVE